MFVRIADNPRHSWERSQFLGRPLRVTACDQNLAAWVQSLEPPNRRACVSIGAVSYGASVEHDNFRIARGAGALQPSFQELLLQRGAIRLRRAATKILYVEAGHTPILNESTK